MSNLKSNPNLVEPEPEGESNVEPKAEPKPKGEPKGKKFLRFNFFTGKKSNLKKNT